MEDYDEKQVEPASREHWEFVRWREECGVQKKVKHLSRVFALAFFLEAVLLFAANSIFGAFYEGLFQLGIFDGTALLGFMDQIFGISYYFLVFLPPYLLYAKLAGFRLRDIPHSRPYAPVVLASTGFSMGISLAGSFLSQMIMGFFMSAFQLYPPQLSSRPTGVVSSLLYVGTLVILAPVMEEIVYRGIIMGSLRQFGDGVAIVLSALLFGLGHGNMLQFPYSFTLGLALGFFVVKTNSIFTAMFIHFINNGIAVFLEFFTENMGEPMMQLIYSMETLMNLLAFILGAIYLVGVRRANWKLSPARVAGSKVARSFFTTLPMLAALLMMAHTIAMSFT